MNKLDVIMQDEIIEMNIVEVIGVGEYTEAQYYQIYCASLDNIEKMEINREGYLICLSGEDDIFIVVSKNDNECYEDCGKLKLVIDSEIYSLERSGEKQ